MSCGRNTHRQTESTEILAQNSHRTLHACFHRKSIRDQKRTTEREVPQSNRYISLSRMKDLQSVGDKMVLNYKRKFCNCSICV